MVDTERQQGSSIKDQVRTEGVATPAGAGYKTFPGGLTCANEGRQVRLTWKHTEILIPQDQVHAVGAFLMEQGVTGPSGPGDSQQPGQGGNTS